MADTATNGARTLGQKIEFIESHRPALEWGKYDITVEQSISVGGQALAGSPFRSAPRSFIITGDRFSLKPDDIYKVFPPESSLGDHSNVLPHVVLKRSTLPWERSAGAGRPWLALLLFEETEKPEPQVLTLGQLRQTSGYTAKFPSIDLEVDQTVDDRVTVIDVKASVLQNILPTGADLSYLAHVRQGTDATGQPTGDELSVVICNRLPVKGGISTAHLVSLEARYKGDDFDLQGAEGDGLVRLVSLKSWSFACLDGQPGFKGLLTKVDRDPGTLRLPDHGSQAAGKYLARGFVPVAHSLRAGEKTVSFYHGPLSTGAHTSDVPLPARAGDELLRFDPAIGMFDVSYAAAWELGRLLALQSKQFSVGLYNWKRANAQRVRRAEQVLLHPHLPTTRPAADSAGMPDVLASWLNDLSLLKGVPFNYLVPDERMLPEESMRFFRLDSLWVECLLDGAFCVGRVATSDYEQDQSVDVARAADTRDPVTGFLLRSDAVAGWPGLLVDAADATDEALECLRLDRLSSNVLLCLFAGEVATVSLHLKPEDLHFGIDTPDQEHPGFHKRLRDIWGQENSAVVESLPWRHQAARTLDVSALADQIKAATHQSTFTSAHFALEMIEGVDMVIFNRQR
jgi:hypothetical protein